MLLNQRSFTGCEKTQFGGLRAFQPPQHMRIYVRDYEFDKEGQFTAEQIEQLRKYFETSEWSPLVRDRNIKAGESSDVMVKLVNGESHGLFILDVEPKEISIVLILGPVHMQDLHKVMGIAVRGALTGVGMKKDIQGQGEESGRQSMKRLWLVPVVEAG
jgi:hypothetical protein